MSVFFSVRRLVLVASLIVVAGLLGVSPSWAAYGASVPSQLRLTVRETAGVARTNEVVRSGVPMPRSLNLKSTAGLAVVTSAGQAVPADFRITARWNAPLSDTTAPIQWLMVSFPASVGARSSASYRIVTNGTVANPAPARPLTLTQNGNLITVDTGAAIFRFGSNPGALFDEVILDNGTRLIGGGSLSLRSNGSSASHPTTRKVWIEHAGPLFASVVMTGAYNLPPVGNGGVGSTRRYVFTAGSATAIVRHAVAWEGNLACNGCTKTTSGAPNGLKLEQVRDTLAVELGGAATVTAVGDFQAPAVARALSSGQTAEVRQLLRGSRTEALRFSVNVGGSIASGGQADGAVLAASGPAGTVAIGLDKMHRYEPQALRRLADGALAIDLVDDRTWLAHHQGLYGTFAVSALASTPSRGDLDRLVWAPLNRPLRAWAEPAWFAASDAVDEIPVGPLPAELASYDTLIPSVLTRTVQKIDELGLAGLTTFGIYPRYWGKDGAPGEIDCSSTGDPTPGEAWDNTFWCGTWADYHNTAATIPTWAMRSGEVEWLDELGVPAALRMVHTLVMQCSPTEKWFYCGQAPAGYGGYRADFNSSHAYLDNVYLYYWLTGDSVVLHTLQRGAETMRRNMCDTRGSYPVLEATGPGGPACGPDHVSTRATFTGRVATQWINAFRFLGLASTDGSFLDDYRGGLARAATQHYVEVHRPGQTTQYGFLGDRAVVPGTYIGGPVWMFGFYDTSTMYRLLRDTNDAPIGNPAIKPSRIMAAVARTLKDIETTVTGDGTVNGDWPKNLQYTYTEARIGGVLSLVVDHDRPIFTPEKTSVTSLFLRAGELAGDSAMYNAGVDMVQFTLSAAIGENAPLGKLQGQYLTRLHAAVARLTNQASIPTPPAAPGAHTAQAASASEIQLAWADNSDDEDGFRVERSIAGGAFQEVQSLPAGTTGVRITGLAASTAYSFRVRAVNGVGFSDYSNTASATTSAAPTGGGGGGTGAPTAPTNLVATAVSATEIQLTWQDNSTNEEKFLLERLSNGTFDQFNMRGANVTSFRVTGLTPGTAYTYRVRAMNVSGSSAYTNEATATTGKVGAKAPGAPVGLRAKAVSPSTIELTWQDKSSTEAEFRIERLVDGRYREIRKVGPNQTAARITGLAPGATYTFRVRAANAAGSSAYSNKASATTGKRRKNR
jgi:hypothetical protein